MFWMFICCESDHSLKRQGTKANAICGPQLQLSRIPHRLQPAKTQTSFTQITHAITRHCNCWATQMFYHTNVLFSVRQSCCHEVTTEDIQDLHDLVWPSLVQHIDLPLKNKKPVMFSDFLFSQVTFIIWWNIMCFYVQQATLWSI